MPSWALVATVKAPEKKVLAFVAHHLSLGASRIFLYFDDPDDPAHATLARLRRVTAIRCTPAYWAERGPRHERHQNRQARNARDAYSRCSTDWLGHIDVDEFIHATRPVGEILAELPRTVQVIKMEPYEAMHDPLLPDDIYSAIAFRGAIRHDHWRLCRAVLGKYRAVNRDGLLSHSVGKVMFRTGIPGLFPRLHSVMLKGIRLPTPDWHPDLKLLHFHAQDRQAWREALPFRLTRGAYQYRPPLQEFLASATPEDLDDFYQKTQVMTAQTIRLLTQAERLILADLGLRQKVRALLEGEP